MMGKTKILLKQIENKCAIGNIKNVLYKNILYKQLSNFPIARQHVAQILGVAD